MKFACEKCQTRYSIADERVRGRVLKIKCKSCANVITVREERAADVAVAVAVAGGARRATVDNAIEDNFGRPGLGEGDEEHTMISQGPIDVAALAASLSAEVTVPAVNDWYVSFDGEQEGPYALERAQARVKAEQGSGREAHCWRPGFLVWLTVEEVPELASALKPKVVPPKRPPTQLKSVPDSPEPKPPRADATPPKLPRMDPTPAPARADATPAKPARTDATPAKPARTDATPAKPVRTDATPSKSSMPALPTAKPATAPALPAVKSSAPALPASKPAMSAPSLPAAKPPGATPFAAAAETAKAKVGAAAAETAPEKLKIDASSVAGVADAARVETGPVALPPAPKGKDDDLLISEPSGLFNLSHVAAMHGVQKAAAVAARAGVPVVAPVAAPQPTAEPKLQDIFDLPEPAPSSPSTPAAPVVVFAAPAPRQLSPFIKIAAVLGIVVSLGLGGALIYVLNSKPAPVVVIAPPTPVDPARKIDDQPIAVSDGVVPKPIAQAPVMPVPQLKRPTQPKSEPKAPGGSKLSDAQKNLAALYSDGISTNTPKELPGTDRASKGGGGASQNAILGVVTQNRRSLNLCYDRVLKHDSTLKRARIVMHVKVGLSGTVTSATVPDTQYSTSEIGTCIAGAVKRWHFPSSDSEYETEFPIILQAE